jgi:hypothetical protein
MNNQNPVINKDIQIANIEAKMASTGNMKFILTDTEKNKYYFFQKNKGVDCDVYMSFTGMGLKIGDSCYIGFTEEQKSFTNQKGENITYTDRFILGLREANGIPATSAPSQPQTTRSVSNPAPQKEPSDTFSRRLGIQGHINALLSNPSYFDPNNAPTIALLVKEAIAIEDEAEKQLNPSAFRQAVQAYAPQIIEPELPVIQQDEPLPEEPGEIDVSDIPF